MTLNSETQEDQGNNTPMRATTPAASAKQHLPMAKTVDSQSVPKRLHSELMALMMSGVPGVSAFPEEDNIFSWKGTISGSTDTVYEGMAYRLSLSFPFEYPFKPPKVKFETMCFHPNVDVYGNICLDILQDKWSSAYDVRTILLSIQSLLGEPNNDSPLNTQAAALWSNQEVLACAMWSLTDPTNFGAIPPDGSCSSGRWLKRLTSLSESSSRSPMDESSQRNSAICTFQRGWVGWWGRKVPNS